MNYSIDYLPDFEKEVRRLSKKYKSLKQDLKKLESELLSNPHAGVLVAKDVRKVRMAITSKNRGKSHGARVIDYVYKIDEDTGMILLLFIYDKAEQETISPYRIAELLAMVRESLGITDENFTEDK